MVFPPFARCIAFVAMFGMPVQALFAGTPDAINASTSVHVTASKAIDLVSQPEGIQGQILSSAGQSASNTTFQVRHAGQQLFAGTTAPNGTFQLKGLKTGVYEVVSAAGVQQIRVWDSITAPPTAKSTLILVQDNAVRGQMAGFSLAQLGILGGTITGISVGVHEANQDSNEPASP